MRKLAAVTRYVASSSARRRHRSIRSRQALGNVPNVLETARAKHSVACGDTTQEILAKKLDRLPSVTDRGFVALPQDGFDDTAQAADRTAAPMHGHGGALEAIERFDPTTVEIALGGEVGDDSGQQRVEIPSWASER
jgi:hypothetical protein